jgi:hypothetical protein
MAIKRDAHGNVQINPHNVAVAFGVWLTTLVSLAIKAAVLTYVIKQVWY